MKNQFWIGLLYLIFAFSCEKPVVVPEVAHESKLIVMADLGSNGIEVYVSYSVARVGTPPGVLSDAEVFLFDENQNRYPLTYDATFERYYNFDIAPLSGNTYVLEVKHPDFDDVTATTSFPHPLEIDSIEVMFIDTTVIPNVPTSKIWSYEFKIHLKEIGEEISFLSLDPMVQTKKMATDSTILVQSNNGGNFTGQGLEFFGLNDYIFRTATQMVNQNKTISLAGEFFTHADDERPYKITFNLKTLSNEKQQFIIFVESQSQFGEDIFILDPLEIRGNIENGYGLFEAFTEDEIEKIIE